MVVVGVHVKAGAVFIVILLPSPDGIATPCVETMTRVSPSASLDEAARFTDLRDRVRQFLVPHSPTHIALLQTRAFKNLTYADTYARVFAVCAVMSASHELGARFSTETTDSVGKTVGVPAKAIKQFAAADVGFQSPPTYWTTGMAESAAVALHVLTNVADETNGEAR